MTKYLSICKDMMQRTISRQTRHRANDFLVIPKAKATVSLTEQMLGQIQVTYSDKEEGPANKVGKMDVIGGDDTKMANEVVHKNVCSTTSRSRSRIQSTQSGFKLIKFNDGRRGQAGEQVEDKDAMADVADIPGDVDNRLPFKNNIEYKWARFMQASKMTKGSITMFFSKPTLAPMRKHLS